MIDSEDHDSVTILTFSKTIFPLRQVKVALLYRSPKSPVRALTEQFPWLANKKADILLKDFNNNTLSNQAYEGVSNVLAEYKLMLSEPTHMNGGLLDHLYLVKQFL